MDLYEQGYIDFSQIEILVLDEADRMLDMGFVHEVKRIVAKLPTKDKPCFFRLLCLRLYENLPNSY